MDRRVKERLIGASILVALIVLVVPELLSGPRPAAGAPPAMLPAATPEPNRTVTVELGTSKPTVNSDAEAPTPAASPASAAPATTAAQGAVGAVSPSGAAASPAPPSTQAASSAAPRKQPARPAAVETASSSPISTARGWSVQLGSFASRVNADNLTRQLKGQGFSVFVAPGGSGSNLRYRVRVGPLADRASAERMAVKLKTLGHISSLVGPAG
ncbi:MAG TPA: SPOR domain-containing protein [Steroidobacteraceae bacterium]|jgi:DedD protein